MIYLIWLGKAITYNFYYTITYALKGKTKYGLRYRFQALNLDLPTFLGNTCGGRGLNY